MAVELGSNAPSQALIISEIDNNWVFLWKIKSWWNVCLWVPISLSLFWLELLAGRAERPCKLIDGWIVCKIFLATLITCRGSVSRGVLQRLLVFPARNHHENSFNFRISGLIGSCKTVGSREGTEYKPTSLITRGYLHGHWHRTLTLMATTDTITWFPKFEGVALTMKAIVIKIRMT